MMQQQVRAGVEQLVGRVEHQRGAVVQIGWLCTGAQHVRVDMPHVAGIVDQVPVGLNDDRLPAGIIALYVQVVEEGQVALGFHTQGILVA